MRVTRKKHLAQQQTIDNMRSCSLARWALSNMACTTSTSTHAVSTYQTAVIAGPHPWRPSGPGPRRTPLPDGGRTQIWKNESK
jgi:hypothetical protein